MSFFKKRTPAEEFNRNAKYIADKCGLEFAAVERAYKRDHESLTEAFKNVSGAISERNASYIVAGGLALLAVASIPVVKAGARITVPFLGGLAALAYFNGRSADKKLVMHQADIIEKVEKDGTHDFKLT